MCMEIDSNLVTGWNIKLNIVSNKDETRIVTQKNAKSFLEIYSIKWFMLGKVMYAFGYVIMYN